MVPFLPGEVFKMLMILLVVPSAWSLGLALHKWRRGAAALEEAPPGVEEEEEEDETMEAKGPAIAGVEARLATRLPNVPDLP